MDTTYPPLRTAQGRAVAVLLYELGFPQHRIGALFDENQGQISMVVGQRRDKTDAPVLV